MSFVLTLSNPNATLEHVGGKGASLAKMLAAGLPVPDGFHVTTEAYRRFVAENKIQARILEKLRGIDPSDSNALENISKQISSFFAEGKTPPEITAAISEAYAALNNIPVAVRSSATAEDLPDASFAGQQETYLNIRGTDGVLEAIKKCWASLWTARAIAYRIKNNIDQNTVALAVVVQKLVFADAAGIMFTANPINGKRGELLINSAWGLGEAVVSSIVTPDTINVMKATGRILHRDIAEKLLMTVRTDEGTSEVRVPDSLKRKAVLSKAQTKELTRLGVKIEQFYRMPMDIEWALEKGRFFIVQARPITVLPLEWSVPEKQALFTRGSLAEHIPAPVTPLFATLGLEIVNAISFRLFEQFMGVKGAQKFVLPGGIYQTINGYVYLGNRMDLKNVLSFIIISATQLGYVLRGSVERWQSARKEFTAPVEEWENKTVENLTPFQLLEGIRTVFTAACKYYTVIQTTLPAASISEVLFTKLYNSLIRRKQEPEATIFLLGLDTVALQAEKSLFDISDWVGGNSSLANYVLKTPTGEMENDFECAAPPKMLHKDLWDEWRLRLQQHLNKFGRTTYEFDFANLTPQETPSLMFDAIKAFLSGKVDSPYQRQQQASQKREQAVQAVLKRVGWLRRGWFLKLLRWAQNTGKMREDSIFDMGMGHPLIRRMFAELGRRFVAGRAIGDIEDIYWLEKSEVEELVDALTCGVPLPYMADRIPGRKKQWQDFLKAVPPVMLPEKKRWAKLLLHGEEGEKKGGTLVLKGVGTSGGVVTAHACVLFGSGDFGKLKPGDVLVAVTTTPAWTPLFASASAVVTDIGGPLSHSSIVAREYNIPAVMATRSATRSIKTGQMVTVDGNKGTVTINEHP